jgi:NADPH:quinone reductase-like Zn-dependent oxidoreductase
MTTSLPALPTATRRVEYNAYGGASVLRLVDAAPLPGVLQAREIVVEVHASALNPGDARVRSGETRFVIPVKFPGLAGYDGAGVVIGVGAGVTEFASGDRVAVVRKGMNPGTLATYVVIDLEKDAAAKIPAEMSYADAAAMPVVGHTALQGLRRTGLKAGESILISGGSGGVGTCAIQLAKHVFKAGRVVVTASPGKHALMKELGADECIDYNIKASAVHALPKVDAFLDTCGVWHKFAPMMKPNQGRLLVSNASAPEPNGLIRAGIPVGFLLRALLLIVSSRDRYVAWRAGSSFSCIIQTVSSAELAELVGWMSHGDLRAVIDTKLDGLTMDNVLTAFARVESGRATGKVVVVMRP